MSRLTFSLALLQHYLRELWQHPWGPVRVPVGVSHRATSLELIATAPGSMLGRILLLAQSDTLVPPSVLPPDCAGVVLLGYGPQRGCARGVVRVPGLPMAPLHELRLVGPGMHTLPLYQPHAPAPHRGLSVGPKGGETVRWSRTIGTLGLEAWQRLTHLHYAVIGVGRTGSHLALYLARLGVQHLTLIDPDRVEPHNLGEMLGATGADVGRLKVDTLVSSIAVLQLPTPPVVVPVPASITRLQALRAVQDCDVVVACVDHDSARLAATVIATVFGKPLLDLATGVHGQGAARQMGADARLVLPGRCLLCYGGLRNVTEARRVLTSAETECTFYAQRHWQQERAGSLASLNQCAVSLGLRLLEDMLAARLQSSTWAHVEFDATGYMTVTYPQPRTPSEPCPLCGLAGWGEDGLPRVVTLLQQDEAWKTREHKSEGGSQGQYHPGQRGVGDRHEIRRAI